ncbi:MAG TPA: hypothetical protein V6D14_09615 [Coleofasciculaceae cyanobacterium]
MDLLTSHALTDYKFCKLFNPRSLRNLAGELRSHFLQAAEVSSLLSSIAITSPYSLKSAQTGEK